MDFEFSRRYFASEVLAAFPKDASFLLGCLRVGGSLGFASRTIFIFLGLPSARAGAATRARSAATCAGSAATRAGSAATRAGSAATRAGSPSAGATGAATTAPGTTAPGTSATTAPGTSTAA
jgi:hypothetical protein